MTLSKFHMDTQFFQQMFQKHNAIMLLLDPITGRFLDSNLSANQFYGYTAVQMKQMNINQINMLPAAEVAQIEQAALQEDCNYFIVPHRLASGEIRTVEVHASPIMWENRSALFAIIHDITARLEAEEALRVSGEQYLLQELFEAIPTPIFYKDLQNHYLLCNQAFAALINKSVGEIIGKTPFDFWPETVAQNLHDMDVALLAQPQKPQRYQTDIYHATLQQELTFLITKSVMRDVSGQITGIVGTLTDITEQKQLEAILAQRLQIFELMVQNHSAIMMLIDPTNGQIVQSNLAAQQFYGYTMAEMRGMHVSKINMLSETEIQQHLQGVIHEERNYFISPHRLASGEIRTVEVHASPIKWKNISLLFTIIHDITARKEAEKALRESEQKLQTILELLPLGVSVLDSNNKLVYANPAMAEHVRLSQEGLLRGDYRQRSYLRADGRPMVAEEFATSRARQEQQIVRNVETGIVQPDNGIIWVNVTAIPVNFSNWQVIVVMEDITERKQAADALRESEQKLQTILELLPLAISVLDKDNNLLYVNPALAAMLPPPHEKHIFVQADGTFITAEEAATSCAIREQRAVTNVEMGVVQADKRIAWENISVIPVTFEDWRVIVVSHDITERKRVEAELAAIHAKMKELAIRDPLTGLYNRAVLDEKFTQALNQSEDDLVAVFTVDLDEFKKINDTHGHHEGDRLLIEIAARMKTLLRETDTLIRLGGDEFLLLAPGVESLEQATNIATRLLKAVRRQVHLGQVVVLPTLSVGIALYPHDGTTLNDLLVNSDRALYLAKKTGKNGYVFAHTLPDDLVLSRVKRRFGAF